MPTSEQEDYSSPPNSDDTVNSGSSYITKGVFRLYNYREPEEYRPPKSTSEPEPTWRAGDGFSDDEITPNFVFLMTGKNKRKRSRSLSAFGQLSLEAGTVAENGKAGANSSQPYRLRGLKRNIRRKIAKDLWPTRDNFAEDLVVRKPDIVAIESNNIAQSTPSFNPTLMPLLGPEVKHEILGKRRASDFENFRRKRRSQSRRDNDGSYLFTATSPQYKYQVSDDGYDEEKGERRGQASDTSEREQQSVPDQQIHYIPETACDYESSDIDSEMLSEYDDLDEMIRTMVQDTQPYDVSEKS